MIILSRGGTAPLAPVEHSLRRGFFSVSADDGQSIEPQSFVPWLAKKAVSQRWCPVAMKYSREQAPACLAG